MPNTICFKRLLLLICLFVPLSIFAQSGTSLQKISVTSVTLIMDSVQTPADMELVRTEVTKHPEVKDFDIKNKNCNFTIDNSNHTLDIIFSDLAQRGQPARIYAIEANQVFTRVPEENCMSKKAEEVKEDDQKRLGTAPDGDR
jgi:hypothetical protein